MSRMKNGSIRCDWCGKLTRSRDGEYTKPDGVSAGYIHSPDWEKDGPMEICEECAEDRCPFCGSEKIVKTTPSVPGPGGWGGRCKACAKSWGLQPLHDDCLSPPAVIDAVLRGPELDAEGRYMTHGPWQGMTPDEVRAERDAYNRACGE
jgi:hypothetical protein